MYPPSKTFKKSFVDNSAVKSEAPLDFFSTRSTFSKECLQKKLTTHLPGVSTTVHLWSKKILFKYTLFLMNTESLWNK